MTNYLCIVPGLLYRVLGDECDLSATQYRMFTLNGRAVDAVQVRNAISTVLSEYQMHIGVAQYRQAITALVLHNVPGHGLLGLGDDDDDDDHSGIDDDVIDLQAMHSTATRRAHYGRSTSDLPAVAADLEARTHAATVLYHRVIFNMCVLSDLLWRRAHCAN